MTIKELGWQSIDEYMSVPIAFEVRERLATNLEPKPEEQPWVKDYDALFGEGPPSYAPRFDVSNWCVLGAFDGARIVGGAVIAFRCQEFDLLEGRDDLAHVVDIRVAPASRGLGVGRHLWAAVEAWCRQRGVVELRVETQDINVPACQFYQAMGCSLVSWSADAYGPEIDESQLIWGKQL